MKPIAQEFDFVLILSGGKELTDEDVDALYESGCSDATVTTRLRRNFLTFSRRADSYRDAVISAIRNVRESGIGVDVLCVDRCNLVTQAEIARRIGRSRQVVSQYIAGTRGPGDFPGPACEICEGSPLWYWCEVAHWLWQNDIIKEDVLREADETDAINVALEYKHKRELKPELIDEVLRLLEPA